MKRPRLLIPDTWHFRRGKFEPLDRLAAAGRVRLWVERSRWCWWRRHGDYRQLAGRLAPHLRVLAGMTPGELLAHRHRDIGVFECARSELLCLLLPRWAGAAGPNRDPAVIDRAVVSPRDREDLLLCMAAAQDWIDFWHAALARNGPFSHGLVHGGSHIHARTLQEVGRRQGLRLFALDHFSTGGDLYFEERTTPLANRSLLADPGWCHRLVLPEESGLRERVRVDAYRRLSAARSRNWRRASEVLPAPPFGQRAGGVVLVLGQAINDFSLIETPLPELSAPAVYRRLIGAILERTNLCVVFAGDPEEASRPNLGAPLTLRLLGEWRDGLPAGQRARLRLMPGWPGDALFSYADWVVSLSSTELMQACRSGLKPAQIGRAFFGGKGFTHDFTDADALVGELAAGRLEGRLSLGEYRAFEHFLMRALVIHLVSNGREGATKIAARLAERDHVPRLAEAQLALATRRSPWQTVCEVLTNPVAALRLGGDWRKRG